MGRSLIIIGGGLAGILSAKMALSDSPGLFSSVRLLERASSLGGLWRPGGYSWDGLRVNLSKFTCAFSDEPWPSMTADFPTAPEVHRYLLRYAQKHKVPQHAQLHCEVESCTTTPSGDWEVCWRDTVTGEWHKERADCLVVAAGIFSKPFVPNVPGNASFHGMMIHASAYRNPSQISGQQVAVVGGSFSGIEIAVDLVRSGKFEKVNLVVPTDHLYVAPKKVPMANGKSVPLDLLLYARQAQSGLSAKAPEIHALLQQLSTKMFGSVGCKDMPPMLGITDADVDIMDRINVVHGQLTGMTARSVDLNLLSGIVANLPIDCIIFASGYLPAVEFLEADALATLHYNPKDKLLPLLAWHDTVPFDASYQRRLAVIAIHKAPFFGSAELQARLAVGILSGSISVPGNLEGSLQTLLNFRTEAASRRPQIAIRYREFMKAVGETLFPGNNPPVPASSPYQLALRQHGPLLPFLYSTTNDPKVWDTINAASHRLGCALPLQMLSTLQSMCPLTFTRQLSGSGIVRGTAAFTPLNVEAGCAAMLFEEEGTLQTLDGKTFAVRQAYIWRLSEDRRHVEVCFAEEPPRVMHRLALQSDPPIEHSSDDPPLLSMLLGHDKHQCGCDLYDGQYHLTLHPPKLEVRYIVKGPNKNYVATTTFLPSTVNDASPEIDPCPSQILHN